MTHHERLPISQPHPETEQAMEVFQGYIEHPLSPEEELELARDLFAALTPAERDLHGAILERLFPEDIVARGKASVAILINGYVHEQVAVTAQLNAQFAFEHTDAA